MSKTLFQNLSNAEKEEIRLKNKIYRGALNKLEQQIPHASTGYFGPDSISWRIYREPAVVLGGLRAVLLQTAHPAIAQGVEDNSEFRNNLFARGRRTIQALYYLIFGDLNTARRMVTKVYNIHHMVRGVVSDETGSRWSGCRYSANDPELLMWVGATVADTSIKIYESLFAPLSESEKKKFAQEFKIGATLNGIPAAYHLHTVEEIDQYVTEMIEGPDLAVGQIGLDIAQLLFANPYTPSRFDERFTIGLLPDQVRQMYHLPWSDKDQSRHEAMMRRMRFGINTIPAQLRYVPAYHQANARVARLKGHPPSRMGRMINWVDKKLYVPLALHS